VWSFPSKVAIAHRQLFIVDQDMLTREALVLLHKNIEFGKFEKLSLHVTHHDRFYPGQTVSIA
jgi:hypothetical protein